jgi:GNAT superfamily N-acetyltransferase
MPTPQPVVRTHLELTDPARIRPAAPPRARDVHIARVEPPDGAVNSFFYTEVGRAHAWTDNLGRTAAEWQSWAERVETWVATVSGERAGYHELRVGGSGSAGVELAYFGLLAAFQGAGIGGHLLTHALVRAFELGPRVWVHTCTLDGPHALANYRARGMTPFREEVLPGN